MAGETESLEGLVKLLVESLPVKAIILFGSRARGDWIPGSDYDLLIIADFKENYLARLRRVLEILKDVKLPVEPHPYTLEEALNMLSRGNPLIVDAMEEGRVLYSSSELDVLVGKYRELKERGLARTSTTIVVPPWQDEGSPSQ
ncbi:nucleotidyltransferase domain-containing protein [Infirmifilum lucidum]|uniref:Nucleotidyltransferase domain-containing protein n=1 Tax=Infirmifilum lucidum TaxID=2776706 RepID=A0A7L9FHQ0_9CREN|nr:nucleotidyltransferase domain-containing protein [Infirmifilum lucidum]QOJ79247.1 nucleotidyltransferase domain-containing protein [Infirmifilum lucidum]